MRAVLGLEGLEGGGRDVVVGVGGARLAHVDHDRRPHELLDRRPPRRGRRRGAKCAGASKCVPSARRRRSGGRTRRRLVVAVTVASSGLPPIGQGGVAGPSGWVRSMIRTPVSIGAGYGSPAGRNPRLRNRCPGSEICAEGTVPCGVWRDACVPRAFGDGVRVTEPARNASRRLTQRPAPRGALEPRPRSCAFRAPSRRLTCAASGPAGGPPRSPPRRPACGPARRRRRRPRASRRGSPSGRPAPSRRGSGGRRAPPPARGA